jgi:DNA-directed RNA polymerase specialized sigma24 family protein
MAIKYPDDVDGLTQRLKGARTREERERLWQDLVPKLKSIARNRIGAANRRGIDSPTELVNEMYPALQRALDRSETHFDSRAEFLAYAAQAMRRQLVANAKRQVAEELDGDDFAIESASPALAIAVGEALEILAQRFPRAVRAFHLRVYGGYSHDEIVELMGKEYRTKALLAADLGLVKKQLIALLTPAESVSKR